MTSPILVFEDDPNYEALITRALNKSGFEGQFMFYDSISAFKADIDSQVIDMKDIKVVFLDHTLINGTGKDVHDILTDEGSGFKGIVFGTSSMEANQDYIDNGNYVGKEIFNTIKSEKCMRLMEKVDTQLKGNLTDLPPETTEGLTGIHTETEGPETDGDGLGNVA